MWTTLLMATSLLIFIQRDFYLLLGMRFLQGCTVYPGYVALYLHLVEWFPASHANTANNLIMLAMSLSSVVYAGVAYQAMEWAQYNLAIAGCCAVGIGVVYLTPESAQWYLVRVTRRGLDGV